MDTVAKFIKALFFTGDDPDTKAIQKFKDYMLITFIIENLLLGALLYYGDDEAEDEEVVTTEQVDE